MKMKSTFFKNIPKEKHAQNAEKSAKMDVLEILKFKNVFLCS